MEPANKRVKTEEVGSSGGGSGAGDNNGDGSPPTNPSSNTTTNASSPLPLKAGGCERPNDLVLVGKLTDAEHEVGVGLGLNADVKTWVTDLYRIKHWYLELQNVDDVVNVDRRKIMIKATCTGFPSDIPPASGLAGIANNDHGHAVMSNIQLLIYSGQSGDSSNDDAAAVHPGLSPWGMISGTPAAWFAQLIDTPSQSAKQIACEFGGSKVYVRQAELLGEQRDWLHE